MRDERTCPFLSVEMRLLAMSDDVSSKSDSLLDRVVLVFYSDR